MINLSYVALGLELGVQGGCGVSRAARCPLWGWFPRDSSPSEVDRRRGAVGVVIFRRSLPERCVTVVPSRRSPVVIYGCAWCPAGVDVFVAWATGHQRFASSHGHERAFDLHLLY